MLRLSTQLRLRLFLLVAVFFCLAAFILWKGETLRAEKDVAVLLRINYRDVSTGFTDRADYQLMTIARDLAERFGTAGKLAGEDVAALCAEEEIAEIYDVDSTGTFVGGSRLVGEKVQGEQRAEFLILLDPDGPETLSQPDRPRTSDGKVFKYAAARYPDGSGYLEVGWSEERFLKYLRQRAWGYTRSWHIDERGFIVFVDSSGIVTSHSDMSLAGKTLFEATGLDPAAIPTGKVFRAEFDGVPMFCLAGPVRDYLAILADPVDDAFASRDRFMPRMAAVQLVIFAALFFAVSRMLRKRVTDAVHRIGETLQRIAAGDLAGRADVCTSLEFAELSGNINATVDALRTAADERMRHIDEELEHARTIQTSALPQEPPENPVFRLAASMTPAREVGGDFYDHFRFDATRIAFLVADVSGKGITAALYMMTAKAILKNNLLAERDPAAALAASNAELCRNNPANMFLTAWVGMLDTHTGRLDFANAGHNPPLVRRADGSVEWLLAKSGPMLAVIDGAPYRARTAELRPGDTLFLYTDGVTEAMDSRGTLFGDGRLEETLRAAPDGSPASICRFVRAAVAAFAAGAPAADDLTVLAVQQLITPSHHTKTFPATREGLAASSAFFDEVLANADPALASPLHIMLDEIASNVVNYSGATVFDVILALAGPTSAQLTVSDNGKPYDPLAHADPDTTLTAADRPIGGLGILIVKKMADSVLYRRDGNRNILTLSKKVKG